MNQIQHFEFIPPISIGLLRRAVFCFVLFAFFVLVWKTAPNLAQPSSHDLNSANAATRTYQANWTESTGQNASTYRAVDHLAGASRINSLPVIQHPRNVEILETSRPEQTTKSDPDANDESRSNHSLEQNESSIPETLLGFGRGLSAKLNSLFGSSSHSGNGPDIKRVFAALAIVLGGYFGLIWVLRLIAPASNSLLPRDVVEVLGKTPFGHRQHFQLVRLGTKLLLLLESAEGVQPIAEVIDPLEVQHLMSLCDPKPKRRKNISPALASISSSPQVHTLRIPAVADNNPSSRLQAETNSPNLHDIVRAIENATRQNKPQYRTSYEA